MPDQRNDDRVWNLLISKIDSLQISVTALTTKIDALGTAHSATEERVAGIRDMLADTREDLADAKKAIAQLEARVRAGEQETVTIKTRLAILVGGGSVTGGGAIVALLKLFGV